MTFTIDDFLGGKIKMHQAIGGYRATSDAVTLSAAIDEVKKNTTILDVGCGTGAVSLCIAARFGNAIIKGIELQENNLEIANKNIKINNFSDRISFHKGNVFEKNIFSNTCFDYVISNPPFMDKDDYASPNDSRDLTRREENLQKWIDFCVRRTKDYGKLFLIAKPDKLAEILDILTSKTGAIKIYPIYSKKNSSAKKIVICATKSSKAKLEIFPPIVLHNDDGKPNNVAKKIQKDGKSLNFILKK